MKAVRFTAEMADGFYSRADRHDAATPLRWLLPLTQRKGTSGCLAVRCYNVITLIGTHNVPLSQYTGEGGYYHTILSTSGKSFFLNLGASALLGYEAVNNGNRLLDDGASLRKCESFIYGGAVTLERRDTCRTG